MSSHHNANGAPARGAAAFHMMVMMIAAGGQSAQTQTLDADDGKRPPAV